MPIQIVVDDERARRISIITGVVGDAELIAAYTALMEDADYDPTLDDLVDTTGVVRVEVTPEGVRRIAQVIARMDSMNPGTRIALVAPGGAAFVMARIYTFYREAQEAPAEHRVFRDLPDAEAWLDEPR